MSDDDVAVPTPRSEPEGLAAAPPWLAPTVRRLLWQAAGVVILVWLAVGVVREVRSLLAILGIAVFFALAMEPAVGRLNTRRGLSRGAATAWCSWRSWRPSRSSSSC